MSKKCYYHSEFCNPEEGWECETCGRWFCIHHNNVSSKGYNVECVLCERLRVEKEHRQHDRKAEYKWANPHEWFLVWIEQETDPVKLRAQLRFVAGRLHSDQIQDLFQSEMEEDGYFEEVPQCT